jgi:hypothetical protein
MSIIKVNKDKLVTDVEVNSCCGDAFVDSVNAIPSDALSADDKKAVILESCKQQLKLIRQEKQAELLVINEMEMSQTEKSRQEMQHYITETIINGLVNIYWKMPDDSFHTFTVQEFKPIYKAVVTHINSLFAQHKDLLEALEAADDPMKVDLTEGWPSNVITVAY